jgi:Cof subfamily protein (haloacid dehalogenase superfamily)
MQLILTDLDETLLHSDKTISTYTLSVLERCKEKGILVGFSTSRGMSNITQYVEQVKPHIVICNGGACIFYENKLLHTESFTLEETKNILKTIFEVCGEEAEITLDTLNEIYWNRGKDKSTTYAFDSIYDDFKNFSKPGMKICVQTSDPEKAKKIADSVLSCDFLPFSDIPWYKFSPGRATKENAIEYLVKNLEIPLKKIVAFGDDFNDIGMLKLCGQGIAMGNAIPQVKEIADDITLSNNEDGVAKYLERLLK